MAAIPDELAFDSAQFAQAAYIRHADDLKATVAYQKDYIDRLHTQLYALQSKYGPAPEVESDSSVRVVAPWLTDKDVMSPLFAAYDARIQELEGALKIGNDALSQARKHADALMTENAGLRGELQQALDRAAELAASASEPGSTSAAGTRGDRGSVFDQQRNEELTAELQLASEEAAVLRQEVAMLTQELEVARKLVDERDSGALAHMAQQKALMSSLAQAQEAVRSLATERNAAEAEAQRLSALTAEVERGRADAAREVQRLSAVVSQQEGQIRDYRTAISELSTQANAETEALVQRTRAAMDRCRELKGQADSAVAAADAARDELRRTQHEAATIRQDAEGMVKVIAALEKRVSAFDAKEARLKALEAEATERIQVAVIERDQALAKEAAARREVARLLERRRVETEEAQRAEVTAVADVRARLAGQLSLREEEMSELRGQLAVMQSRLERADKDARAAQHDLTRMSARAKEELRHVQDAHEQLLARVRALQEERDAALKQAREAVAKSAVRVEEAQRDRALLTDRASSGETALVRTTQELAEAAGALRSTQSQLAEVTAQLDDARREVAALREQMSAAAQAHARVLDRERRTAETRTAELQDEVSSLLNRLQETSARLRQVEEGAASHARTVAATTERALAQAQGEARDLRRRNEELLSALHQLQSQHRALVAARSESDNTVARLQAAVEEADAVIKDLTAQLQRAGVEEDGRIQAMHDLKTQAELSRLTAARATARADALQAKLDSLESSVVRDRLSRHRFGLEQHGDFAGTRTLQNLSGLVNTPARLTASPGSARKPTPVYASSSRRYAAEVTSKNDSPGDRRARRSARPPNLPMASRYAESRAIEPDTSDADVTSASLMALDAKLHTLAEPAARPSRGSTTSTASAAHPDVAHAASAASTRERTMDFLPIADDVRGSRKDLADARPHTTDTHPMASRPRLAESANAHQTQPTPSHPPAADSGMTAQRSINAVSPRVEAEVLAPKAIEPGHAGRRQLDAAGDDSHSTDATTAARAHAPAAASITTALSARSSGSDSEASRPASALDHLGCRPAASGDYSVYEYPPEGEEWPVTMPFIEPLLGDGIPVLCIDRRRRARAVALWLDVEHPHDPVLVVQRGRRDPLTVRNDERVKLTDIVDIRMGSGASDHPDRAFTFTGELFNLVVEAPTPQGCRWMFQQFARLFQAYATVINRGFQGSSITRHIRYILSARDEEHASAASRRWPGDEEPSTLRASPESPQDYANTAGDRVEDDTQVQSLQAAAEGQLPRAASPAAGPAPATLSEQPALLVTPLLQAHNEGVQQESANEEPEFQRAAPALQVHDDAKAATARSSGGDRLHAPQPVPTQEMEHGLSSTVGSRQSLSAHEDGGPAAGPAQPVPAVAEASREYSEDFDQSWRSESAPAETSPREHVQAPHASGAASPTVLQPPTTAGVYDFEIDDIEEEILAADEAVQRAASMRSTTYADVVADAVPGRQSAPAAPAAQGPIEFEIEEVDEVYAADEHERPSTTAADRKQEPPPVGLEFGSVADVALLPEDDDQLSLGQQYEDAVSEGHISDYF